MSNSPQYSILVLLLVVFLGVGRNRGEIAEVVVFGAVRNRFQVFGISAVGDADTGDLTLLCHIHSLLFFHNGIVGKMIPGDSATLFYQTDDPLCVGICLRNLIQGLFYKFLSVHMHHSFCVVFTEEQAIYKVTTRKQTE